MVIDPEVEESTRTLIGHAIRGELEEFTDSLKGLNPERVIGCLTLCLRVSAYVVIDICGHAWPTDADLREIAQRMAVVDLDFNLEEPDAYAFLRRAALGFEPLSEVFPAKDRAIVVPFLTSAALLASYRTEGRQWWEYLDVIEHALEQAAPLPKEAVPAVLLWSRLNHALETEQAEKRPAEA